MNRKQKRRLLEQRLHAIRKKRKEIDKELVTLGEKKGRLSKLINELDELEASSKNKGVTMSTKQVNITDSSKFPTEATGIWIVGKREGNSVSLVKFNEFLISDKPFAMRIQIPDKPLIGKDGLEVTFNVCDLVSCVHTGDLANSDKFGLHFANVTPGTEIAEKQYAVLKAKILGLPIPQIEVGYLVVDGNFRKRGE